MKTFFFSTFATPLGAFSVAIDDSGAVAATAFGPRASLQSRLGKCSLIENTQECAAVRKQVLAYFANERREFSLPLSAAGTAFQQRVWASLRSIPFGETRNYANIARELGTSARAVGRANATNPICLIVPCHRVIGADGSLTGYAFGEEIKRKLLEHEDAALTR